MAQDVDDRPNTLLGIFSDAPQEERLRFVVETMREMSRQTDPQAMVHAYAKRMRDVLKSDRQLSLSRRDLQRPLVRVTRSNLLDRSINPWTDAHRLPLLSGGLLADLIWGDEPVIIPDLHVPSDDPSAPFLEGMRSLVAVPLYDQGVALNMVIVAHTEPRKYRAQDLPGHVWLSNLFGRATQNLVLSGKLKTAYDAVDHELQVVADIQRGLLPATLPDIPTLDLAAHYQTSLRAGGDYYDFFPLPDGRWGILIADVSGHGTPAAVIMAVTHCIAHVREDPPEPPSKVMEFINRHLTARYTNGSGTFVTAFFGLYDPATRELRYCSAGHCPPRVYRGGAPDGGCTLDRSLQLPLGIEAEECYTDASVTLRPGDTLVLYTDGITEARPPLPAGLRLADVPLELFGTDRLDGAVATAGKGAAEDVVASILRVLEDFTGGTALVDDRTLVVARVR